MSWNLGSFMCLTNLIQTQIANQKSTVNARRNKIKPIQRMKLTTTAIPINIDHVQPLYPKLY